jgi:Domain of unknown function (DUF6647)
MEGMMEPLLVTIMIWLSANFGLPAKFDPPTLAFVPASELISRRYGPFLAAQTKRLATERRAQATSASELPQVIALYSDIDRTIYLPKGWRGRTPAELSVLVHELVHHLQSTAGLKYPCPQEREKLAYAAQDKWLHLFGVSLESEFQIDKMTVLVTTSCAFAQPYE